MNPVLIYQSETKLDYNNKFTINFIDGDINKVQFLRKNQYYISSLNCNTLKSNNKEVAIDKTKKKLVDDLSFISKEILNKGPDRKNEINYVFVSS